MSRHKLFGPALRGALLLLAAAASLTACKPDSTMTAQQALTAVEDAAQTCKSLGTGVEQCLGALDSCMKDAADAGATGACKSAFAGCLPVDPPSQGGDHHGHHHGGPGGGDHHGPGGDMGGGDMAGGCPGMGGGDASACNPSAPIVSTCSQELDACLAAGTAPADCVASANECVASAIQLRFKTMCDAHAAQCDASGADQIVCDQLSRACKDGVSLSSSSPAAPAGPSVRSL